MAIGHYFYDLIVLQTDPLQEKNVLSNGVRYPLVGGTRERCFAGTSSQPRKLPENAQTPTTMAPAYFAGDRVHAVLGAVFVNHNVAF